MSPSRSKPWSRLSLLVCGLVAAAALASAAPSATAQSAPAAHWANYEWNGGSQTADLRAFWLFDRTGDASSQGTIRFVVDAWNAARDDHPGLPFIGLYRDDANVGRCFVNQTPGYSVASACMMPKDIHGVKAIAARNSDASGHLVGAAFAIGEGLGAEELLTVVCHAFGHVMGLEDSTNPGSCMSPTSTPGQATWYDGDDADAIIGLYDHDENAPATTTTVAPATTTTVEPTTTTTEVPATTTTVEPTTTTTIVCDPLPDCLLPTTTTIDLTTTTVGE